MKALVFTVAAAFVLSQSARAADVSVKLTDIHLCCKSCVTGVEKAVEKVDGAKVEADQEAGTVTLTGPDKATVQKGATALIKAGYFAKCSDSSIKLNARSGAQDRKVQSVKVEGVHLCCAKCVKAVDRAVRNVPGVKEQTAVKGAKTFEVTGDFNEKELLAALEKEGLCWKIGK